MSFKICQAENLQTNANFKLSAYVEADGYSGAVNIFNAEQALLGHMKNATTDCRSVTGTITDEEAEAMLATETPVIPNATNALAGVSEKKTVFDKVYLATNIVKNEIKKSYKSTIVIYICVHDTGSIQHPSYIPVINDYIDQLDTAFKSTYINYGLVLQFYLNRFFPPKRSGVKKTA